MALRFPRNGARIASRTPTNDSSASCRPVRGEQTVSPEPSLTSSCCRRTAPGRQACDPRSLDDSTLVAATFSSSRSVRCYSHQYRCSPRRPALIEGDDHGSERSRPAGRDRGPCQRESGGRPLGGNVGRPGRYRFLSVAPGAYTVTADTLSGFGRVQKKATVTSGRDRHRQPFDGTCR